MRIGLWWVSLYTLRIMGAVALAVAWLLWRNRRLAMPAFSLGLLGVAVVALLLGRAGYILTHTAYFRQNPADMLNFRSSAGIHGFAALLGGLLGALLWSTIGNQPFWTLITLLSPAALWIAAGAWWACEDVGCVWGRSVTNATGAQRLLVVPSPDLYRSVEPRIAVPALGMGWATATALLAGSSEKRGVLALSLYLAGAAGLTLLRADPAPTFRSQRLDTLLHGGLAILMVVASLAHLLSKRTTGARAKSLIESGDR